MSRRKEGPEREAPAISERLKAERIQERLAEAQPQPEEEMIFRETFLFRFPDPEDAEALRLFGRLMVTLANGAGYLAEGEETATASELAGVAADLRRLSGYLQTVLEMVEGCAGDDREARLIERARDWARATADLAREIQEEIGEGAPRARVRGALEQARRLESSLREALAAGAAGRLGELAERWSGQVVDLRNDMETALKDETEEGS